MYYSYDFWFRFSGVVVIVSKTNTITLNTDKRGDIMQDLALEKRVDRLERAMMELAYQARRTEMEIESLSMEMKEFKNEMKEFKDEMKEFKNEMLRFKDEMKEFKDEMKEFKDEMKEFKDEMREFKNEVRNDIRESNKRWGALANKLGTIVEDIVAPAIGPVLKKYFHCDPEEVAIRIRRRKGDLKDEFDAVAVCENMVFLFEVKATPKPEYVIEFKEEKTERFKKLFPEHKDKELILIFASLRLEEDIINLLTKLGIYGMAYREWEYMDILNFDEVCCALKRL